MLVSHIRHLLSTKAFRISQPLSLPGSEIQAPIAIVIMFGLLSSTASIIVVVPVLYERLGRPVAAG